MRTMLQLLWGPAGLIFLGAFLAALGALWASQQQVKFERDLRAKSDEIADLNREIANLVTGGDSFCYVTIASINPNANRGILTVVHQGDYSTFDINVRMVDLQKSREIKDYTLNALKQAQTTLQIGSLIKGTALAVGPFDLGSSPERDFNIFFIARNSQFTQFLRLRKIDDKWVTATKVERDGKIIFEKVDEGFPGTDQGQVQW